MEVLENLMRKLKKKEVDHAVLSYGVNNSRQIKFADNKIVKTAVEEMSDVGVFVVKDKKIITTNFEDTLGETGLGDKGDNVVSYDEKDLNKFVEKLMGFLKAVHAKKDYRGINEEKFEYKEIKNGHDPKVRKVDDVDLVEAGINAALKAGARRTNGIFEVHDVRSYVLTSQGISFNEKSSELYFSMRSFAKKDESGHMHSVSRTLKDFDSVKAGKESGRIAKEAKDPVGAKKGTYDLILSPLAFAPILNSIGDSASIFSVESGMSFFSDKMGKKIGSRDVTIYDDATLEGGIGSAKADAEGVATRKNVLIEEGVYKKFLHNTSTARNHNVESTGNSGLITPEAWNVVVKEGRSSVRDMIKKIKKGIYITNVWYTRFANYHTGDFSTIPRDGAFLIEKGKVVGSLKSMRISDNVLRMLKNISEVGNDSMRLRTWEADMPVCTPSVLIKNCSITTPHV
jgi:PmbA protein